MGKRNFLLSWQKNPNTADSRLNVHMKNLLLLGYSEVWDSKQVEQWAEHPELRHQRPPDAGHGQLQAQEDLRWGVHRHGEEGERQQRWGRCYQCYCVLNLWEFMTAGNKVQLSPTSAGWNKTPSGGDNSGSGWTADDRLYLIRVLYIQGWRVWAQVWILLGPAAPRQKGDPLNFVRANIMTSVYTRCLTVSWHHSRISRALKF